VKNAIVMLAVVAAVVWITVGGSKDMDEKTTCGLIVLYLAAHTWMDRRKDR
jgi:hypothetical protein